LVEIAAGIVEFLGLLTTAREKDFGSIGSLRLVFLPIDTIRR